MNSVHQQQSDSGLDTFTSTNTSDRAIVVKDADVSLSSLIFSLSSDDEGMSESYVGNQDDYEASKVNRIHQEEETPRVVIVADRKEDDENKIPRVKDMRRKIGKNTQKTNVLHLLRSFSFRKNLKNFSPFTK